MSDFEYFGVSYQQKRSKSLPSHLIQLKYKDIDTKQKESTPFKAFPEVKVNPAIKNESLIELLNQIYFKNNQFEEFQEQFHILFERQSNESVNFQQIHYEYLSNYLEKKIREQIYNKLADLYDCNEAVQLQEFDDHSLYFQKVVFKDFDLNEHKYCDLISLIHNHYKQIDEKSGDIQKIVDLYLKNLNNEKKRIELSKQIVENCIVISLRKEFLKMKEQLYLYLNYTLFKLFMGNLSEIFHRSKCDKKNYRAAFVQFKYLNQVRYQKNEPAIKQTSIDKNSKYKSNHLKQLDHSQEQLKTSNESKNTHIQYPKNTIFDYSNSKEQPYNRIKTNTNKYTHAITSLNTISNSQDLQIVSKKKKKKNQNVSKKQNDEVKEFEKKLEFDFEQSKNFEKIQLQLPNEWIQKIKNKLFQIRKH